MLRASNKKLNLILTLHLNKIIYVTYFSFFSTRLSIFWTLVLLSVHKSDTIKPHQFVKSLNQSIWKAISLKESQQPFFPHKSFIFSSHNEGVTNPNDTVK